MRGVTMRNILVVLAASACALMNPFIYATFAASVKVITDDGAIEFGQNLDVKLQRTGANEMTAHADVRVAGDLDVTGSVNNVNITAMSVQVDACAQKHQLDLVIAAMAKPVFSARQGDGASYNKFFFDWSPPLYTEGRVIAAWTLTLVRPATLAASMLRSHGQVVLKPDEFSYSMVHADDWFDIQFEWSLIANYTDGTIAAADVVSVLPTLQHCAAPHCVLLTAYGQEQDGAYEGNTPVRAYDPITNTWSTRATNTLLYNGVVLLSHRLAYGLVHRGAVYLLDGYSKSPSTDPDLRHVRVLNRYTYATDTWERLALPPPFIDTRRTRRTPMKFYVDDGVTGWVMYALDSSKPHSNVGKIHRYHFATDTWSANHFSFAISSTAGYVFQAIFGGVIYIATIDTAGWVLVKVDATTGQTITGGDTIPEWPDILGGNPTKHFFFSGHQHYAIDSRDGWVYVVGGKANFYDASWRCWKWRPGQAQWTQLAGFFPDKADGHANMKNSAYVPPATSNWLVGAKWNSVALYNGAIHVTGGFMGYGNGRVNKEWHWKYNIDTDEWSELADLPVAIFANSLTAIETRAYPVVFGLRPRQPCTGCLY